MSELTLITLPTGNRATVPRVAALPEHIAALRPIVECGSGAVPFLARWRMRNAATSLPADGWRYFDLARTKPKAQAVTCNVVCWVDDGMPAWRAALSAYYRFMESAFGGREFLRYDRTPPPASPWLATWMGPGIDEVFEFAADLPLLAWASGHIAWAMIEAGRG